MPLSLIESTRINTSISAPSKSSMLVFMLKIKRVLEMPLITLHSFCMQRDLKISPLFKRLEMWSEYTELSWEFTTIRDNSMPVFSITVHGLSFQLIPTTVSHTSTLAKLSILKSTSQLSCKTQKNGHINMLQITTLLQMICMFHSTKLQTRKVTLIA